METNNLPYQPMQRTRTSLQLLTVHTAAHRHIHLQKRPPPSPNRLLKLRQRCKQPLV